MEIFIARQPIFSRQKKLFGYELLHRVSTENAFLDHDGTQATSRLVVNTFMTIGLEKIVSSKWAFINFTEQHLLDGTPLLLPRDKIIVEVLEQVRPTSAILAACRELKQKGYVLALDDFVFKEGLEALVELADIIKIDFQDLDPDTILGMRERLRPYRVQLLAEKIESYGEFDRAWKMGFHLFQGFFFSRPEVMRNQEIPATKVHLLSLLAEVNRRDVSLERVEGLIAPDVGISYKLLRYINSAYYYLLNEVSSIRHALTYLGESGTRQFVSLVATSELAVDKPDELLRTSIIRARLCELLAGCATRGADASELFLVGLFSLLSAMLDMEMKEILERLPLSENVKAALLDGNGPWAPYLKAVIAYENGDWVRCRDFLRELGVSPQEMLSAYLDALHWSDHFCGSPST